MSPTQPRRRAAARTPLDGYARLEHAGRALGFDIADVSFGGIGLAGDARDLKVGDSVRLILRPVVGPRLDIWAIVRHVGTTELGLAWSMATHANAETVLNLVDLATRYAPPVPLPIGVKIDAA